MADANRTRTARAFNQDLDHSAVHEAGHRASLLVLTSDSKVADTVREAAPQGCRVIHGPNLDAVADDLRLTAPGVLVLDASITHDVGALVAQLTQHFPELVVVLVGKAEERSKLMQLTAGGGVFRFLLTPLSYGQARLALEAANARYEELKGSARRLDAASSGRRGRNYSIAYALVALGVVAAIGVLWSTVRMATSTAPPIAVSATPSTPLAQSDPVQVELALAQEAFEQGRLLEPPEDNALYFYRSALALDANSEAAKNGIRAIAEHFIERAENALTAGDLERAARGVEIARDIEASHPRLAFVDLQIQRERERLSLSRAQDIGARVSLLVAQSYERMRSGQLIAPVGRSARDALLAARRLDPTEPLVIQALRDLSAALVDAASNAVTAGQRSEARVYLDAARQIGFADASLATVERALARATREAAGREAQPPAAGPAPSLATGAQLAASSHAIRESVPAVQDAPVEVGPPDQASGDASPSPQVNESSDDAPLIAADLRRIREVPAEYPAVAAAKRIEGWVDIEFTISEKGVPEDLQIRAQHPRGVFDRAARQALQRWRFEPIVVDGRPVARRAILRMRFQLD